MNFLFAGEIIQKIGFRDSSSCSDLIQSRAAKSVPRKCVKGRIQNLVGFAVSRLSLGTFSRHRPTQKPLLDQQVCFRAEQLSESGFPTDANGRLRRQINLITSSAANVAAKIIFARNQLRQPCSLCLRHVAQQPTGCGIVNVWLGLRNATSAQTKGLCQLLSRQLIRQLDNGPSTARPRNRFCCIGFAAVR